MIIPIPISLKYNELEDNCEAVQVQIPFKIFIQCCPIT